MSKDLTKEQIISLYRSSVAKNVEILEKILNDSRVSDEKFLLAQEKVLLDSSDFISSKWVSGAKYLRTWFSLQAFGNILREDELLSSVKVDAMINILDDMLDEKLGKEAKILYMFELVRVMALLNEFTMPAAFQKEFSLYIHKLISLAVLEQIYLERIKNQINVKDMESALSTVKALLLARAKDIDIFVTIPMITVYRRGNFANKLRLLSKVKRQEPFATLPGAETLYRNANVFRALNIAKKDILDLQHDESTEQITAIGFLYNTLESEFPFFMSQLTTSLADDIVEHSITTTNGLLSTPTLKFKDMMIDEAKEIETIISTQLTIPT